MSNALAIAAVTATIRGLLQNSLNSDPGTAPFGGSVSVSALAPDRIAIGENEVVQLNLFLYHLTPNPGWRNAAFPSHDSGGQRLTNPPLALDLHYLLTAFSQRDVQAEILLGYAMQILHESPILPRDAIRAMLDPPGGVDPTNPVDVALVQSDLADQVELIKVTPQSLTSEEIYRLWGAFQTSYRPSVAYHVSVVLIEGDRATRSPLPVLTRGRPVPGSDRDEGVAVQANLLAPFPTLWEVLPPNRQPAVRMGDVLSISGHHLAGDQVFVHFRHARLDLDLELSASSLPLPTESGFQVQISPAPPVPPLTPGEADSPRNPDNWPVGVYGVSAIIRRAGQPDRVTNELPVVLAPGISVAVSLPDLDGNLTFTATVKPKVWQTQTPVLIVGDRELLAQPIASVKTDTIHFTANVADLPTGLQSIRLRVDGIESILIDRTKSPPVFDPTQQVTL